MEQPWNSPEDIPSSVTNQFVNATFPVRVLSKSGELLWENYVAVERNLSSSNLQQGNLQSLTKDEGALPESSLISEPNTFNDFDNKVYHLSNFEDIYFGETSTKAFDPNNKYNFQIRHAYWCHTRYFE